MVKKELKNMANNTELRTLVMSNLPIKDENRIVMYGHKPDPTTSRKYWDNHARSIDVTKQVHQLLKEGKIKRVRKYGFGHSGNAGHTFFVENK